MIRELCERHSVAYLHTSKLFFGQFTSSITINFPPEPLKRVIFFEDDNIGFDHANYTKKYLEARKRHKAIRSNYVDNIFSMFSFPDDTHFRMNESSVTFYLNDPLSMTPLISSSELAVTKVVSPRNEADIAYMSVNSDKIIRPTYFFNKYPYRVKIKNLDICSRYIMDNFADEEGVIDLDRACHFKTSKSFFLMDSHEVVLAKIGLGDNITCIEEIVLSENVSV